MVSDSTLPFPPSSVPALQMEESDQRVNTNRNECSLWFQDIGRIGVPFILSELTLLHSDI